MEKNRRTVRSCRPSRPYDGREPAAFFYPGPHAGDIERNDWPLWLGETEGDPGKPLRTLLENVLRVWPIGKAVGNVKNDGPELLEPTTVAELALL